MTPILVEALFITIIATGLLACGFWGAAVWIVVKEMRDIPF